MRCVWAAEGAMLIKGPHPLNNSNVGNINALKEVSLSGCILMMCLAQDCANLESGSPRASWAPIRAAHGRPERASETEVRRLGMGG